MDPTGFSKNGEPKSEKRMGVVKKATRPLKNSNDINYVTKILIGQKKSVRLSVEGSICLCILTSNTVKGVPLFEGFLHICRDFFCFVNVENDKKE